MSVVVEYRVRPDGLVLAPTLDAVDVSLDVEEITALGPERPQLFAWVDGDLSGFEAALAEDPTVVNPTTLGEHGDRLLCRVCTTDALFVATLL